VIRAPERRLYLLRHAKSSWAEPERRDRDRPLAPRGLRDARRLAACLLDWGIAPALVICSSSLRTRETLRALERALVGSRTLVEDELYGASQRQLLQRLRRIPDEVPSTMLIGHNPGLQELCLALCGRDRSELARRVEEKFPTAGLATLALRGVGWHALDEGRAELIGFVSPRELPES
jgi:phosphohistidine phosphatase